MSLGISRQQIISNKATAAAASTIFAQTAKRFTLLEPNPSNNITAAPAIGDTAASLGTLFANAEAPTATRGLSTSWESTVANTYCGMHSGTAVYRTGFNINAMFEVYIARSTDIRCWIGISANSSLTVSDTPTGAYAMFRFSSIAGDTHWKCITSDGTTQTIVDSGITPDTGGHRFGIQFDDTNNKINFYIDGVLVGTSSTHLPTAGVYFFNVVAMWAAAAINPIIGVAAVLIQTDK